MRLQRDGEPVRLITRGGYDWARRYPSIVEVARKNRQIRFVTSGSPDDLRIYFIAADRGVFMREHCGR